MQNDVAVRSCSSWVLCSVCGGVFMSLASVQCWLVVGIFMYGVRTQYDVKYAVSVFTLPCDCAKVFLPCNHNNKNIIMYVGGTPLFVEPFKVRVDFYALSTIVEGVYNFGAHYRNSFAPSHHQNNQNDQRDNNTWPK